MRILRFRGWKLAAVVGVCVVASAVVPSHAVASSDPASTARTVTQACEYNPQPPHTPHANFPLASWEFTTAGSIHQSSPTLVNLTIGGRTETVAVFGDEDGYVYVVNTATCALLPGWPKRMAVPKGQLKSGLAPGNRHAVIESAPAIGWLDGPNKPPVIVVGAGSTWDNTGVGEAEAFSLAGRELWDFPVQGSPKNARGVFSSPAFGPVVPGTGTDVVFGSWDYYLYVLDAAGKLVARFDNKETIWSSPSLYQFPGHATDDIFIGLDKTESNTPGGCIGGIFADLRYSKGLGLHVAHSSPCQGASTSSTASATAKKKAPPLQHGQAIWSTPAITDYNGGDGGTVLAAIGTSFYRQPYEAGTDRLYVYKLEFGGPMVVKPWAEVVTPGPVLGSPAIGQAIFPGSSAARPGIFDTAFVCPKTDQTHNSCLATKHSVAFAWELPTTSWQGEKTFSPTWSRMLTSGDSLASPILTPLQGERGDDVLVGSGTGLVPLAGGTGAFLSDDAPLPQDRPFIGPSCGFYNAPAVADVMGSTPYTGWHLFELCSPGAEKTGGLFSLRLPVPPGEDPSWPMFRGDPMHSGVYWPSFNLPLPAGDPN